MYFKGLQSQLVEHLKGRVRAGEWTESGLARFTGFSQPHLHHVLNGRKTFSFDAVDGVLRRLGLQVEDLLPAAKIPRGMIEVPFLGGLIGPGYPFPTSSAGTALMASAGLVRGADPAAAWLSADDQMGPPLRGGDLVLIDRSPEPRRHAGPGLWVAAAGCGSLIRRIQRVAEGLFLLSERGPSSRVYVSLDGRNILDVVLARVLWFARPLE